MKAVMRRSMALAAAIVVACGIAANVGWGFQCPPSQPPPSSQNLCQNSDPLAARQYILADAKWGRDHSKYIINIKLWSPGGEGVIGFNGLQENEVQVVGATIKRVDIGNEEVDLVLLPVRGKDRAELTLQMQCDVKRLPLRYTLDLSEPHWKKGNITIELVK